MARGLGPGLALGLGLGLGLDGAAWMAVLACVRANAGIDHIADIILVGVFVVRDIRVAVVVFPN